MTRKLGADLIRVATCPLQCHMRAVYFPLFYVLTRNKSLQIYHILEFSTNACGARTYPLMAYEISAASQGKRTFKRFFV
ncbi:hypothetical protein Pcar_3401 [Syntrophotalea carbinolica DSM 2380]|uniref:Uncharacterized protein n=1 Tax=Syntrophotalea carbinolica (strain DSM 2380 / NBRC 103641 / GraBd1) TaxID=338963 RepID=Q0C6C3_SYNC1|nr:hypothetical protein Pcar_3401 [Syntrophotalea carbinolica DSM 2380]